MTTNKVDPFEPLERAGDDDNNREKFAMQEGDSIFKAIKMCSLAHQQLWVLQASANISYNLAECGVTDDYIHCAAWLGADDKISITSITKEFGERTAQIVSQLRSYWNTNHTQLTLSEVAALWAESKLIVLADFITQKVNSPATPLNLELVDLFRGINDKLDGYWDEAVSVANAQLGVSE